MKVSTAEKLVIRLRKNEVVKLRKHNFGGISDKTLESLGIVFSNEGALYIHLKYNKDGTCVLSVDGKIINSNIILY
jgi:hypothetical protein